VGLLAAALVRGIAPEAAAAASVHQAENGVRTGVTAATAAAGYTGSGYVTGFDAAGDSVAIPVPMATAGHYELAVRYRSAAGPKNASLLLNGAPLGEVRLDASATFREASAGRVELRAGTNTVTVQSNWGWYDIDAISLTPVGARPAHLVTGALVNRNASAEARGLMRYLNGNYGKAILAGQQDMDSIGWVERNVGKAPAVAGLDLIEYSPSRVQHGSRSTEIENALAWDKRGGIVTMTWHWNAPAGLIDKPGKEWWRGFYTDSVTFDLAAALADKNSANYRLLIRDIDVISEQLKRLQAAGVPVLWRPLHEAEGGWFWWGAKGPGPARELWRIMYDRMTNHHRLNNLIWVWNSAAADWYPGADVVDILSTDHYPPVGDHGPLSAPYERLVSLGGDRKLVALAEIGGIPDPDKLTGFQAHWSWFVTWTGSFIEDGKVNPRDFLKRVYHHPYVITLDEVGDFKNPGAVIPPTSPPPVSPPPATTPPPTTPPGTTPPGTTPPGTTPPATTPPAKPSGSASAPPTGIPAGAGCTATYRVTNSWPGGFQAEVTVRNDAAAPLRGWRLTWTPSAGQQVSQAWGAQLTATGGRVSASNMAWNGALGAKASTTVGLIGGGTPDTPTVTCTPA
jgi:mannan endo-1,4-beta-mannosidase